LSFLSFSYNAAMVHLRALVAALILLVAAAAPADAKSYSAERFDSHVRLLEAGAIEVTETVVFRFEDGTFQYVFREISTRRTDGVDVVRAEMDGRGFPFGDGPGEVSVRGSSKIRVTWRFAPTAPSTHTFTLTYVARGVVEQTDTGDLLAWRSLPSEHAYRIGTATARFEVPAASWPDGTTAPRVSTHRVSGDADVIVEAPAESGSGVVLARVQATQIRSNGWVETRLALRRSSGTPAPPLWQQRRLRADALRVQWAIGAGATLLGALVLLFAIRQRYDAPPREPAPTASAITAPPDSLAPALGAALAANGGSRLEHALATIVALAGRGLIIIDEEPRRFLGQRTFTVRAGNRGAALVPHERAAMDLAFGSDAPAGAASLGSARGRLVRGFRTFRRAVRTELNGLGLIDPDRDRTRRRLQAASATLLIGGALAAIGAALLVNTFGPWPLLIPAALAIAGIIGLIATAASTPLSNEGIRRAERWRGYQAFLKSAAHDRERLIGDPSAVLPFAVALGLASAWAKYVKSHPAALPGWFRAVSSGGDQGAFAAFIAYSGATGHGGGAAGGGAAGGGASGAG
jgi:predicted membrane protein DUF2207